MVKINDPLLEAHLAAEAKHQGKSRTALTREAINRYLEDLEDYRDAVAATQDPSPGVSLEDLMRRYSLDH